MALSSNLDLVVKMPTDNSDIEMDTDSDDEYCDYYNSNEDHEEPEVELADQKSSDPEYFEFQCLTAKEVKAMFKESVDTLCASLPIKPSVAKLLLHLNGWSTSEIISSYKQDATKFLVDLKLQPSNPPKTAPEVYQSTRYLTCPICLLKIHGSNFCALACGHFFCRDCWLVRLEMQIIDGITTAMECMGHSCKLLIPDDFVLNILQKPSLKKKYEAFLFSGYVKGHPQLRYCPGESCNLLIFAKNIQSKRVICKHCNIQFCYKCSSNYHAPANCEIMRKWAIKCADDSETANYLCANTKDCPKCHFAIEKNGGCNHMLCSNCKHDFCWVCLRVWTSHAADYSCSRYSASTADDASQNQARISLTKYLFYFHRWENHGKSLKLEKQTLTEIKDRAKKKIMAKEGTWIDWQYLIDAANLLAKCRYTLQYTYPCAYYMEPGPRLTLFEYQQAQLESEIEDLAWKVEHAETTDRGDLENQMYVAEKKRITLLKDFLPV